MSSLRDINFKKAIFEIIVFSLILYLLQRSYTIVIFILDSLSWHEILAIIENPSIYNIDIEIKPSTDVAKIISGVFFAPLIETFVNQFFVVTLCLRYLSERNTILVSGLLFGLCHYVVYSYSGVMAATFNGFLFAHFFIKNSKKYGVFYAYCYVAAIHSLFNLMVLMF